MIPEAWFDTDLIGVHPVVPVAVGLMAVAGVQLQTTSTVGAPEPGYHLEHDHGDIVGGAIFFGFAVAAAITTIRAAIDAKRAG